MAQGFFTLPGVGFIANQVIGNDLKNELGEMVANGFEKWDVGDIAGATADFCHGYR